MEMHLFLLKRIPHSNPKHLNSGNLYHLWDAETWASQLTFSRLRFSWKLGLVKWSTSQDCNYQGEECMCACLSNVDHHMNTAALSLNQSKCSEEISIHYEKVELTHHHQPSKEEPERCSLSLFKTWTWEARLVKQWDNSQHGALFNSVFKKVLAGEIRRSFLERYPTVWAQDTHHCYKTKQETLYISHKLGGLGNSVSKITSSFNIHVSPETIIIFYLEKLCCSWNKATTIIK